MLADEMVLLKNKLREKGLDPKNMFFYEFRNLSLEHERRFQEAREEVKRRIRELANLFPNAFETRSKRTWVEDFLLHAGVKTRAHIFH